MGVITATYRFTGFGEDFGPRKGRFMVCLHTSEAGASTVADAMTMVRWQDRDDVSGSYNRIICSDGVLSCVPDQNASGGINPFSWTFQPRVKSPWLYDVLPDYAVNDPNAYALQLCFMGRKAHFDLHGWPAQMIDAAARSILEEEQATGRRQVLVNHADFQTDRSDAGPTALALVKKRYAELTAPQEPEEMPQFWRPVQEDWLTRTDPPTEFYTGGPGLGERKEFVGVQQVHSIAESIDGKWRLVPINEDVVSVPRRHLFPVPGTRRPTSGYGWSEPPPPDLSAFREKVAIAAGRGASEGAIAAAKTVEP